MAFTQKAPAMPDPSVPVIDPATGRMSLAWHEFFFKLLAWLTAMGASIP